MKKLSLFLLTLACVFQFSAQAQERPSYIAIEANSGKLLFSSNAEEKRPVASLSQVANTLQALAHLGVNPEMQVEETVPEQTGTPLPTNRTGPQRSMRFSVS